MPQNWEQVGKLPTVQHKKEYLTCLQQASGYTLGLFFTYAIDRL